MKEQKKLTEQQEIFLEALMGECRGDIKAAMNKAGYGPTIGTSYIIKQLRDEIIEASQKVIAGHTVEATFAIIDAMRKSADPGVPNKLKAAENLLNRAGVVHDKDNVEKKEKEYVVILPAKKVREMLEEEDK